MSLLGSESFTQSDRERKQSSLSLIDINTSNGADLFQHSLQSSRGKALLFVHALSHLDEPVPKLHKEATLDQRKQFTMKVRGLSSSVSLNSRIRIPIVMMVEGDKRVADSKITETERSRLLGKTRVRLGRQVESVLGKISGEIFYVITLKGGPAPLKQYLEAKADVNPLKSFIGMMKDWGLRSAWLAGTKVKTDESNSKMRKLGQLPWYADNMSRSALESISKYRDKIEASNLHLNHPLRQFDPDGCLPTVFRELTNSGVDAYYTQVTFPLQMTK